jgi:DinB superfamily
MAAPIRQSEYADLLRAELVATDARLQAAAGTLGDRGLNWPPQNGGWSIGRVLEHLVVAADSYLTPMRRLVSDASQRPGPSGDPTWRPSLMGGFLAKSLRSARKSPAPRAYLPALVPRPNVLAELRARLRDTALLLERARPLEWERIRLSSPVSRLIRLNLGDCFAINVAHAHRHAGQIERIRSDPGFPSVA